MLLEIDKYIHTMRHIVWVREVWEGKRNNRREGGIMGGVGVLWIMIEI